MRCPAGLELNHRRFELLPARTQPPRDSLAAARYFISTGESAAHRQCYRSHNRIVLREIVRRSDIHSQEIAHCIVVLGPIQPSSSRVWVGLTNLSARRNPALDPVDDGFNSWGSPRRPLEASHPPVPSEGSAPKSLGSVSSKWPSGELRDSGHLIWPPRYDTHSTCVKRMVAQHVQTLYASARPAPATWTVQWRGIQAKIVRLRPPHAADFSF
jgi:hypothetical protein